MLFSLTTHGDPWAAKQTGFKAVEVESIADIADMICRYSYSPAIFKDNYRKQDNFLGAQMAVLDFDDGLRSIEEAKNWLLKYSYQFILGTTRSHQKEKNGKTCDRYRAIIPGSTVVKDLSVFRANMRRVIDAFRSDKSCRDGARFYYPCVDVYYIRTTGQTLDWNHYLHDDYERVKTSYEDTKRLGQAGIIPPWMRRAAMASREGRRNDDAFKLGCGFYAMGWDIGRAFEFLKGTPIGTLKESELLSALQNGYRRAESDLSLAEKKTGSMVEPVRAIKINGVDHG